MFSRSIVDNSRSIIDNSRSPIDDSRSIIDDSRSIIDDSRSINYTPSHQNDNHKLFYLSLMVRQNELECLCLFPWPVV
jgi:hypothetical protein